MKYLIILNSTKYSYHNDFVSAFRKIMEDDMKDKNQSLEIDVIDFATPGPQHEKYHAIENARANLIINLDLAGFELMTEGDNISLNGIPCRVVNILFQKPDFYGNDLKFRQNLSMFTYFPKRVASDEKSLGGLAEKYPNIPNPEVFCEYDYKAASEGEVAKNAENLKAWIPRMLKEVRL